MDGAGILLLRAVQLVGIGATALLRVRLFCDCLATESVWSVWSVWRQPVHARNAGEIVARGGLDLATAGFDTHPNAKRCKVVKAFFQADGASKQDL